MVCDLHAACVSVCIVPHTTIEHTTWLKFTFSTKLVKSPRRTESIPLYHITYVMVIKMYGMYEGHSGTSSSGACGHE